MREEELVKSALEARERAYTPYSHFKVGAALLTADGEVIQGCNIENASYSVTNCGERTAFFNAVSQGKTDFEAIAIVGGAEDAKELSACAPCGVCRQVMKEFCRDDFSVILGKRSATGEISWDEYKMKDLLPLGFGPENL